jgi:glutamine synthetase
VTEVFADAGEAIKFISDNKIDAIDLKIAGLAGQWMHVTIPARNFSAKCFENGVGYDGSSGSGFSTVESGDLVAIPDPTTAFVDPFWDRPTLSFICNTATADSCQPFPHDPRTIARKAVAEMTRSGIADLALFAPELEFHVFDAVRLTDDPYHTSVEIRSAEVDPDGSTYRISPRRGYLRVPPSDQLHELRQEIVNESVSAGISVRYHHHEVGAPGQCEIEVELMPLVVAADRTMLAKYIIKNVARRRGRLATFMPKPVFGEAGNGMHVHHKLQLGDRHLFYDNRGNRYAELSDTALHHVGGLLRHGPALTALTNPSTNSFKRLVEGYEAPVTLFFSLANRSAAIRVPKYAVRPEEKRIEYRPPDGTANVYLCLAAMLMAGIDGIESRIDPTANNMGPFDVDIAAQDESFRRKITSLPRSLEDALTALAADREFLTRGGVFSDSFIDTWIESKMASEVRAVSVRPHPYEYQLYLDA